MGKAKNKPWYKQDRLTWKVKPVTKIKDDEREKIEKKALDDMVREAEWESYEDEEC